MQERSYRRSLGSIELVSLGLGGTIGSGIFVAPGVAAGLAGSASLLAWIVVGVATASVALTLARIQSGTPGGTHFGALFVPMFGRTGAAGVAALYVVGSVIGVATIAAGLGQYLAFFGVTPVLPVEIGLIGGFLAVNLVGIRLSGTTENVLTGIKMLAIVAIAVALLPSVRIANLLEPRAVGLGDLLRAAIVVYWPYTGFEISAIPVAETRAPQRIGRALIIVMTLVAVVYVLLNVALIGAVGSTALAASPAPVAYAASRVFAGAGAVVAVVGIVTMLSALNAYIVGTSRVLHELAADRAVPRVGALSRRGVPAAAIAITCLGATAVLLVSNRFVELAAASVVATLVPYIAICVAAFGVLTRRAERALAIAGIVLTAGILCLYLVL